MKTQQSTSDIYVFLGGTRSGKSACAEQKVQEIAEGSVLYVATAHIFADDAAMQQRILTHKQRRPAHWETLECPLDLAKHLHPWLQAQQTKPKKATLLIDCVTLWVTNMLLSLPEHDAPTLSQATCAAFETMIQKEINALLSLSQEFSAQWVFVSGETGLGGIGASALERAFQDGLGLANQLLVAQSKKSFLTIAGRTLTL